MVAAAVAFKAVTRLLVVAQVCASVMVVGSAARLRGALKVPKGILDYVFHMVVDAGVNSPVAPKEPKAALCFAKLMAVENAASYRTVTRVLREVLHSVKAMEVGNVVPLMVVESARKVCTEEPSSVWLMGVGNAVL